MKLVNVFKALIIFPKKVHRRCSAGFWIRLSLLVCYTSQKVWGETFHQWGYARESWTHSTSQFSWLTPKARRLQILDSPRVLLSLSNTREEKKNLDLPSWKSRPVIKKISACHHKYKYQLLAEMVFHTRAYSVFRRIWSSWALLGFNKKLSPKKTKLYFCRVFLEICLICTYLYARLSLQVTYCWKC